ncbi:MAG: hypothetical protein MJK18_12130, partial [Bdellovibrionales bacterium]|nr:hypothetical protein [Bdellovibrionales bacterium]
VKIAGEIITDKPIQAKGGFIKTGCDSTGWALIGSGRPGAFCIKSVGGNAPNTANTAVQDCFDEDNKGAQLCSYSQVKNAALESGGTVPGATGGSHIIGHLIGSSGDDFATVDPAGLMQGGVDVDGNNPNKKYFCCF